MTTYPDYEALYIVRDVSDDGTVHATLSDPIEGNSVAVMASVDSCHGFEPVTDVEITFRLDRRNAYMHPGQVVMVRAVQKPTEFPSLAALKIEIR